MTKTIKYQPSFVNTGDFSKEDLEALKKQFNLENYKEHYDLGVNDTTAIWFTQKVGKEIRIIDYHEIDLKMHLSNCCDYQVKENTDICGKCKEMLD